MEFDGVIYVPEYSTSKPKEDYINQASWEREALINATVITFWIPRSIPDMPAFTTNVEFGYWIHSGKILYGRPNESLKIKYLDWLYMTDTNKKPFNNINDLLFESVLLTDKLFDNSEMEILPLLKRKILIRK